ncbi:MAG TPA: DUF4411 family protein [Phycisphaerae bacterium]|nr:DUF4411 family protein [Phycisphaerae bacterium]
MNGYRYILDADVFMCAARSYYAFDLAPRFWQSLIAHAQDGRVMSIDRVQTEIQRGKDELASWTKERFASAFMPTDDPQVIDGYRELMEWVQSQDQFFAAAKAEFASKADGWLVAYATAKGYVVVTQEVLNADVKRKVPIPNLCEAFNVPCINTFSMLRNLGVRFG